MREVLVIMNMRETFKEIRRLAEPYLDTRKNNIHTDISTGFGFKLLEREGGDEDAAHHRGRREPSRSPVHRVMIRNPVRIAAGSQVTLEAWNAGTWMP